MRQKMKVKVINNSSNSLPEYSTSGSAGMDVRADINDPIIIPIGGRVLIPTGLHFQLPIGYEVQVRPRSGLAIKYGITVCNAPGTIDSDFTGEVMVILINHGNEPFTVNKGDRIGQFVLAKYETIEWKEVDELSSTERGEGGFGHTGKA